MQFCLESAYFFRLVYQSGSQQAQQHHAQTKRECSSIELIQHDSKQTVHLAAANPQQNLVDEHAHVGFQGPWLLTVPYKGPAGQQTLPSLMCKQPTYLAW